MSSLAQRMNAEELQAANDGLCKKVADQSALIRELVGALGAVINTQNKEARAAHSMKVASENFSNPQPEINAYSKAMYASSVAVKNAHDILSRVPEEYRATGDKP